MSAKNIQVAIKARPLSRKEKETKINSNWRIIENSIQLLDSPAEPFYFDHIFDDDQSNQSIFEKVAQPIVHATLQGFNGTIFAYGQTSSGKTYTMLGDDKNPGVMVLAAKEIFAEIEKTSDRAFLLRVSFMEIYNEKIFDLLNKNNQDLKIHETVNGEVSVNCTEFIITSETEMMHYLQTGSKLRKCGETNVNERSSRSHAIFKMIIESREIGKMNDDGCVQISNLNLVDLAGSERANLTGATGSRLKEGSHINRSLLSLSCVIKRLSENESDKFINYRDSKLTRILQASLGGNALTVIICTIKLTSLEETNSTLNFAMRAKSIKNKPQINEVLTDAAMMKRLEKEISRLESALEIERSKNSQIAIEKLERQIREEGLKIVHYHFPNSSLCAQKTRRQTWCAPSHILTKNVDVNDEVAKSSQLNTLTEQSGKFFTPLITLKDDFVSKERESPQNFNNFYDNNLVEIKTPRSFKNPTYDRVKFTPPSCPETRYSDLASELEDLRNFTNLEKMLNVEHEPLMSLSAKLEKSQQRIEEVMGINQKLTLNFEDMQLKEEQCRKRIKDMEQEIMELKGTIDNNEKAMDFDRLNCEKCSIEYEFEQYKLKQKNRENELLSVIREREKEISKKHNQMIEHKKLSSIDDTIVQEKLQCQKFVQNEEFLNQILIFKNYLINEKINISNNSSIMEDNKLNYINQRNYLISTCNQSNQKLTESTKEIIDLKSEIEKLTNIKSFQRNCILKLLKDKKNLHTKIKEGNTFEFKKIFPIKTEICEIKEQVHSNVDEILKQNIENLLDKMELRIKYDQSSCSTSIIETVLENLLQQIKEKNEIIQEHSTIMNDFAVKFNDVENYLLKLSNALEICAEKFNSYKVNISEVVNIKNEYETIQLELDSKNRKNLYLTELVKNNFKTITFIETQCHSLQNSVKSLEKMLENPKQKYEFLENNSEKQILELQHTIERLTNEIQDLDRQKCDERKKAETLLQDLYKYQTDIEVYKQTIQNLEINLQGKNLQYLSEKANTDKLLQKIIENENQIDLYKHAIKTVELKIEDQTRDYLRETTNTEKLLQKLHEYEKHIEILKKGTEDLESQLEDQNHEFVNAKINAEKISQELRKCENDMEILKRAIENSEQKFENEKSQHLNEKTKAEQLTLKIDGYEKKINVLTQSYESLEINLKDKNDQYLSAKTNFEKLLQTLRDYENQIEILKNTNKKLELELEEKNHRYLKGQSTVEELMQKLREHEKQIENFKLKCEDQTQQCTICNAAAINLLDVQNKNANRPENNDIDGRMHSKVFILENFDLNSSKDKIVEDFDSKCNPKNQRNELQAIDNKENKNKDKLKSRANSTYNEIKNRKVIYKYETDELKSERNVFKHKNRSPIKEIQNLTNIHKMSELVEKKIRTIDRQSWDSYKSVSTMTEFTDYECSCRDLDVKVTELKRNLVIKESQINILQLELKHNPIKDELEALRNIVREEELEKKKLQLEINSLRGKLQEHEQCICRNLHNLKDENQIKLENFNKVLEKYEDLKKLYRVRNDEIKELKSNSQLDYKKNEQQLFKQIDVLKSENLIIKQKYEEVKFICAHRIERIKTLENKIKHCHDAT